MKKISTKTNITPPPRNAVIAWVLALFSIILITGSVLAAGRCVPCKLNHYCVDGLRYQCPTNTPVTQGTGAGALSECLTCVQRNGNSANPIYDDLVGDCVSCVEYDSSTPIWDGNACVACSGDTPYWNGTECSECKFSIGDEGNELCIIEIQTSDVYGYVTKEESTEEFLAKYGIEESFWATSARDEDEYDYWAGATKYCQDKGLRLPTTEELNIIMNELFILDECTLNDDYYYACSAINNKELYDFLYINDIIFIWGAEEDGFSFAYLLEAFDVNDEIYETQIRSNFRSNNLRNALCVK